MKTDYTVDLTLSKPANGTHFVAGETPIVTLVIKDAVTGTAIDHTKISDAATSDFGVGTNTGNLYGLCTTTGSKLAAPCTAKGVTVNGTLNLYVSGPRALKKPAPDHLCGEHRASSRWAPGTITAMPPLI